MRTGKLLAGLACFITLAGCSTKPAPMDVQNALAKAIEGAGTVKELNVVSNEQVELMRTPAWKVSYTAKVELAMDFKAIRRGTETSTAKELLYRLGNKSLGKDALAQKKGALIAIKGTVTLMSQDKVWAPMGFGE
jgi:hypothetical protein